MVDTRRGLSTSPYTQEQQEKMVALVRENKERKELQKQAKLKAIAEEQAGKMKRLEEEMKRVQKEEEERRKVAEEEAAAEEEKERMRIESGEGGSGTKRDKDAEMEKKITSELAAMKDPMERREREEEHKLAWKLRMKREKKRRREEVNKLTAEVAKVQECRKEVEAQADDKAKWDKVLGYLEVLSTTWMEELQASWSQEVALSAMRLGLRDFAREIVTHIGGEVKHLRDNVGKFCEGAIEGAEAITAVEGEARPRKDPVKLKFPDADGGKSNENFDNWEASVNRCQDKNPCEGFCPRFSRLPSPSGEVKTARLFHVSGVDNTLAHFCLSAPAFVRLVKEQLEDQVVVVYVRPVTAAKKEDSSTDPTIAKLLEEFKDLNESPTGVVPRPIQHRIEIELGSRTPKGTVYRMSPRELGVAQAVRRDPRERLDQAQFVCFWSTSPEGELRMCVDYRGLNAITVKNAEPLPRIDDLLDRVQGCKYFSKIDLKSGYHQIEVHPDDQYKIADDDGDQGSNEDHGDGEDHDRGKITATAVVTAATKVSTMTKITAAAKVTTAMGERAAPIRV
ncbi:hypothetical protein CBR_g12161 [Chara braunii]|uniref:Reverse transcriptase domain-containing protein n=1 Tax=Chara braunii TaxID=69332 RepID=A0A388KRD2_CHABU|nr:hypothetical protein CBR_g12161 [Chara braunii]|eukprot:GBG72589.1 hypothetical protein CBR_g12161 [Chara braunii]